MPYAVLANRLAFQETDPRDPKVPIAEEEVVEKGQYVPAYATTGLINALSAAGLIVWTENARPDLVPEGSEPEQYRSPEQPAVVPSDPNGASGTLGGGEGGNDASGGEPLPDLPKPSDNKETWEQYAPHVGIPVEEAEAMNKTDLMAEVKARYAAAQAA